MARTAGRSRGCGTCRKRRIKCDEKLPVCTQCKKSRKPCPGAITDTFYIIASSQLSTRLQAEEIPVDILQSPSAIFHSPQHVPEQSDQRLQDTNNQLFDTDALITPVPPDITTEDISSVTEQDQNPGAFVLKSYYQPSRVEAFEQLFFSHFFDCYGKGLETVGACSWLSKIPYRLQTLFPSVAMKYSARATSMAFYGTLVEEIPIQTEARKTYVMALQAQRESISSDETDDAVVLVPISDEAICIAIMMSYFEIVIQTTPNAWIQHMDAAAAMLDIRGFKDCQEDFLHQLFRTARLGMAFASILRQQPHGFSQEMWKTVPFRHSKIELDFLVDVVLSIPELLVLNKRLEDDLTLYEHQSIQQVLKSEWYSLIRVLDDCTQEFTKDLPREIDGMVSWQTSYPNPLSGCLAAMRHATYLICFSFLSSMEPADDSLCNTALSHSEEVMTAVSAVDNYSHAPASCIYLATMYSINAVASWSPSESHKKQAMQRLKRR